MKIEKKLRNNVRFDYISNFLQNLNMQSSVWVLYLAYCGMNLAEIGLLEGIYHATSIVCEVPSGAAADLFGRKKCMVLSRICIALSCIIMLFSAHFWLFAVSFMMQALGNNLNSGSEEALIYDSMKALGKEEHYMGVYGRLNVVIEVSQQLAAVMGGILAEYSFAWCYAACCVIAVTALIPVLFMTEVPPGEKTEKSPADSLVAKHFRTSVQILKSDVRILNMIVFYAVVFAGGTVLFFYSQQYYAELGYSKIGISIIMLIAGVVSCMGALAGKRLFLKMGKKLVLLAGVCIAAAFICYGFQNVSVSVAAFAIAEFFNSALYLVQSDSFNTLIPSGQRATLISVDSMCFSVAMIVMFPLTGALADMWGLAAVFAGTGVLLAVFVFARFATVS